LELRFESSNAFTNLISKSIWHRFPRASLSCSAPLKKWWLKKFVVFPENCSIYDHRQDRHYRGQANTVPMMISVETFCLDWGQTCGNEMRLDRHL
jgi:hypothetical protein